MNNDANDNNPSSSDSVSEESSEITGRDKAPIPVTCATLASSGRQSAAAVGSSFFFPEQEGGGIMDNKGKWRQMG